LRREGVPQVMKTEILDSRCFARAHECDRNLLGVSPGKIRSLDLPNSRDAITWFASWFR
jgi:hypothetical protein